MRILRTDQVGGWGRKNGITLQAERRIRAKAEKFVNIIFAGMVGFARRYKVLSVRLRDLDFVWGNEAPAERD